MLCCLARAAYGYHTEVNGVPVSAAAMHPGHHLVHGAESAPVSHQMPESAQLHHAGVTSAQMGHPVSHAVHIHHSGPDSAHMHHQGASSGQMSHSGIISAPISQAPAQHHHQQQPQPQQHHQQQTQQQVQPQQQQQHPAAAAAPSPSGDGELQASEEQTGGTHSEKNALNRAAIAAQVRKSFALVSLHAQSDPGSDALVCNVKCLRATFVAASGVWSHSLSYRSC